MASDLIVPVVKLEQLRPHPNADKLELVNVLGYQMCVPKGLHKDGDVMVYFPADTLIPATWADSFGVRKYLKGKDQDRVGRIKLRGEPSFGLVVQPPKLPADVKFNVGDNVADYYGAKKYEPPVRATAGDAAARDPLIDPFFEQFTDVQNGRMFTDIFVDGEEVICTEKIHGTNCKVGCIDGKPVAGSMGVRRKRPTKLFEGQEIPCKLTDDAIATNTYWFPFSLPGVRSLMSDFAEQEIKEPVLLYGEVYGGSIQSLDYGIPKGKGLGFRAFGLKVNGRFLDWDVFADTCIKYGVKMVPVLGRGPFSMEKAKHYADGTSVLWTDAGVKVEHMREGCVIYPVKEREHPKIGRVILKYIGTEYELSKHKEQDTKDV